MLTAEKARIMTLALHRLLVGKTDKKTPIALGSDGRNIDGFLH